MLEDTRRPYENSISISSDAFPGQWPRLLGFLFPPEKPRV